MNKKLKGSIIATAAAGLFLSGGGLAVTPAGAADMGKCRVTNNNACKGKAACNCPTTPVNLCAEDAKHDCAGKNSCKGKGWVYLSDDEGNPKMVTKEECDKLAPSIFKAVKSEEEKEEKKS